MPFIATVVLSLASQTSTSTVIDRLRDRGLTDLGAYEMLKDLTGKVGARVSGSNGADKAVLWVERQMKAIGLSNIQRVPCLVPHWERGNRESLTISPGGELSVCALGMSVGTPTKGVAGEVIEVKSLEEAAKLGRRAKGKIVFYNRPFDAKLASTFEAYGGAVDQRYGGASVAAKNGAVAILVRSMTQSRDDAPHTGAMGYEEGTPKIPAAAIGVRSAEKLSALLKRGSVKARLQLSCKTLPDKMSANVIGEIPGSVSPEKIVAMGGHLDSWDLGTGAHDDGAGIVHAMEAVRLIKVLGLKPKMTIRVVAWMNEENGGRGAEAYAERVKREPHYAAFESDSGGFMPRALGVSKSKLEYVQKWLPKLQQFGIERFVEGGADADNGPLEPLGATLFSLIPDNQRYFDVHHSRNDVIYNVHDRELEFGAIAFAALAWLVSEEGLGD
ncbi:MAG: M20/M25/M40 family metallo-hydrolase [Chthonomonadaceae bacterium]|nr:M20/M25/M40 family metallo-hydrolase [Chthonomonadaceae bacterium]